VLFEQVIGQKQWKSKLIQEIKSDKVPHAQLFLGDLGNGGLELALGYAQYLMCLDRKESDSCGQCASCRKVQLFAHPDFHVVFPTHSVSTISSKGLMKEWREFAQDNTHFYLPEWMAFLEEESKPYSIGTKESVEIHKSLSLKSYEGGYRVLLIWKAEEMNTTFANKVLKLLEEPPEKTIVLLVAEDQESLLTTIVSRTQIKKINPIEEDVIVSRLVEKHQYSADEALSICLRANRSWGKVRLEIGDVDESAQNRELFIELMRSSYKKNVMEMMDCSDKLGNLSKSHQIGFLEYALYMFRQSLMKNYTGEALFQASNKEAEFLKNFAKFITGNNIVGMMENFNEGIYHINRNANSKLFFTQLTFKVMRYIHFA
jgi:DNA polymerase-3 subunit delta'